VGLCVGGTPHCMSSLHNVTGLNFRAILHFREKMGEEMFNQFYSFFANRYCNMDHGSLLDNNTCPGLPAIGSLPPKSCGRVFSVDNPPNCLGAHTSGHGLKGMVVCEVCKPSSAKYELEALRVLNNRTSEQEARLKELLERHQGQCPGLPAIGSLLPKSCGRAFSVDNPPNCLGALTAGHGLKGIIVCTVCKSCGSSSSEYELAALEAMSNRTPEQEARLKS